VFFLFFSKILLFEYKYFANRALLLCDGRQCNESISVFLLVEVL
jgi:hypothetical protein